MKFISKGIPEIKHRLIILTDMENEPDDSQTMVRLLMYANEVDIEGLIAVTSCHLPDMVFPESIQTRVQAYGVVRKNLMLHAPGWPTEETLMSRVAGGQRGYGMKAVGNGKSTPGSEMIIRAIDRDDTRPVWFAINAGANTLAQALWDVKNTRSPEEIRRFVSKIRVYDDSGQDDAGAWICSRFPDIFYLRSQYQVFGLYGPEEGCGPDVMAPLDQFEWTELNIRTRHGILGALYPQRLFKNGRFGFMEGGGTTTWLGLVNKGLYEPEQVTWGGWGGRFSAVRQRVAAGQFMAAELEGKDSRFLMYPQARDTSYKCEHASVTSRFSGCGLDRYDAEYFTPVWRWRNAYTADFKARLDWCVMDYLHANHHPVINLMGDENRTVAYFAAEAGECMELDASASWDPDDKVRLFRKVFPPVTEFPPERIRFHWYCYPEAGTYKGGITIENDQSPVAEVLVPEDSHGKQIHVILEVWDTNEDAPLCSYRRIVIDVSE